MNIHAKEIEAVLNAIEESDVQEVIIEQPNINIHIVRDGSALAVKKQSKPNKSSIQVDPSEKVNNIVAPSAAMPSKHNSEEINFGRRTSDSEDSSDNEILSPEVGIFLRAAKDGDAMLVKLRDEVVEGQVLAYVLANGIMYEIKSEYNGKITEILVENEQAVEFAQPIFRLK